MQPPRQVPPCKEDSRDTSTSTSLTSTTCEPAKQRTISSILPRAVLALALSAFTLAVLLFLGSAQHVDVAGMLLHFSGRVGAVLSGTRGSAQATNATVWKVRCPSSSTQQRLAPFQPGPEQDVCTDVCSASASAPAPPARVVRTHAQAVAEVALEEDEWWKQDTDLWLEVKTEEEFQMAISSGDKPVIVGERVRERE